MLCSLLCLAAGDDNFSSGGVRLFRHLRRQFMDRGLAACSTGVALQRAAVFTTGLALALGMSAAASAASVDLSAAMAVGDENDVSVELELGGSLVVVDEANKQERLPLSATASLQYTEHCLQAASPATPGTRVLRVYHAASATIETKGQKVERNLPEERSAIVAAAESGSVELGGLQGPLSREQYDLIQVIGNSLALSELLPGRTLSDGDSWDHDKTAIQTFLGLDQIESCEVSSVVDSIEDEAVQLRMAGSVRGKVDGAETEIELKGAYLYDIPGQQITKFNLAVKEKRKPGAAAPGLDVIAKVSLRSAPADILATPFSETQLEQARRMRLNGGGELVHESPRRAFRFRHGAAWYVTADSREMLSLRLLDQGKLIAHCNIAALADRAPERAPTLKQFQRDIRASLKDNVEEMAEAREWQTAAGGRCLAVYANGKVKDVPVQWRYYQLQQEDGRRASVTLTIEQSLLEAFADADRTIVESLELTEKPVAQTARK